MDSADFRNEKLALRKSVLEEKLRSSGEEARLEGHLRQRLIESGWKDLVKAHCKEIIRKKGSERLSVEELVYEVAVKGKAMVPLEVKEDLLRRIRRFFEAEGLV